MKVRVGDVHNNPEIGASEANIFETPPIIEQGDFANPKSADKFFELTDSFGAILQDVAQDKVGPESGKVQYTTLGGILYCVGH